MKKKYYIFEMDMAWLQVISTILLIVLVILTYYINPSFLSLNTFGIAFIIMIPYMVLHELLHSLSYILNGAKFSNITYGMHLEKGILCCLCKQNISKRNILISLLTPFFMIGVIAYIIGLITNNSVIVMLSIFNLSGCSGDLIMFYALLKLNNFEFSEYDNPLAFGLYSSNDLSKNNMFGLNYIESVECLEKKDLKKVNITKSSIVIVLLYILIEIMLITMY